MLLLQPLLACADAGSGLCTFCPDLCTLCSDLCTLRLWCYFSIIQHMSLAATGVGGIFPSAVGTNSPCTGGSVTRCNLHWWSSFHPLAHILHLRLSNLHCVVVVHVGGSCMYIYIYLYRACGVPLHLPFDANHCFCIDGYRMQQNN